MFFSPLLVKLKGTIGLHSVRLSVHPSVSVFKTFFLNPCIYWPDFWHGSQSPCFTSLSFVMLHRFLAKLRVLDLINFKRSNSFPDFFSKRLQILTRLLAWKSIRMTYKSGLSFVTLHRFLAKLRALDLVNFTDEAVFGTFFLNACLFWPDFWHVSQSPWFTDQFRVSLRSTDFWRNYGSWT